MQTGVFVNYCDYLYLCQGCKRDFRDRDRDRDVFRDVANGTAC